MPTTIGVDENNDLYLGKDGNFVVLTGLPAILQLCKQASLVQLGEMIYRTNEGLPNFEALWNGSPNLKQYESALRITLLKVPGVKSVKNLVITKTKNILSYSVEILTEEGTGVVNGGV